jgi:hypothetical protein
MVKFFYLFLPIGELMEIKFLSPNKEMSQIRMKPIPANQLIPSWWKDMPIYSNPSQKLDLDPHPTVTAKKCFPLLDAISSGYIMRLWSDILVTQTDEGPYLKWSTQDPVADAWSWAQSAGYEIPDGYDKTVFKYLHGWVVETPKNYSCLVTHPFGYNKLPFRTLTGIVDTDELKTHANSPFVVKKGFEGIILKGTPMFQIIPFKRDEWKSTIKIMDEGEMYVRRENIASTIVSSYGNFMRKNKKFK